MRSCLSCIVDVPVNSKIRTDRVWNVLHYLHANKKMNFHLFPESKFETWTAWDLWKKDIIATRLWSICPMLSPLPAPRQHPTMKSLSRAFPTFQRLSPACLHAPFAALSIPPSSLPGFCFDGSSNVRPYCGASCAVQLSEIPHSPSCQPSSGRRQS